MNIKKSVKKSITKYDVVLIIFLLSLSAVWFFLSFNSGSENLKAEIYSDGKITHSVKLSEIKEPYTVKVNGCEIELSKEGAVFLSSECKDELCVKRGTLTKNADTMACVPQKVALVIKNEKNKSGIDAIVY